MNDKLESLKKTVSDLFNKIKEKDFEILEGESAMKGFTKNYYINGRDGIDVTTFLEAVRPSVVSFLSSKREIKINFVLTCTVERVSLESGEFDLVDVPLLSKTEVILGSTDVTKIYRNAADKIKESLASFQMRGSNWRFKAVTKFNINTIAYKPLKGSSYFPLPPVLANRKAIINMQNDDNFVQHNFRKVLLILLVFLYLRI